MIFRELFALKSNIADNIIATAPLSPDRSGWGVRGVCLFFLHSSTLLYAPSDKACYTFYYIGSFYRSLNFFGTDCTVATTVCTA
jgi:hypothetical protein